MTTSPVTPEWNISQSVIDINSSLVPNITSWCYNYVEPYCLDGFYYFVLPPFKLTPAKIVSAFFMAVMIVVSLSGNILVCVAFYKYRRLRTITNYFVISLAISDILVGSLAMPLWLSHELTEWRELPPWIKYETLTKFWQTMDILSAVSSIVNLTIISVDRFFSIMYPLRHRNFMIPMRAMMFMAAAWLYSLSISLSNLSHQFQGFPAFSATMGFFLPLVIIVASYSGIFIRMKQRNNGISANCRRMEKEMKVARTILIVVSLFILCWLPFFLFSMIYHYCRTCTFDRNALIYAVSIIKWMQYLNSCCNPFVYGFFNANFKQAFNSLFKQCCSRGPHYFPSESSDPDRQDKSSSSFKRYTASIRRCTKRVTDSITRPDSMRTNSCSTVNTIASSRDVRGSIIRTKSRTSSDTSPKLSTVRELDCSSESSEELTAFIDVQPTPTYLMNGAKRNSCFNGVIHQSDCNGNGLALLLDDSKESDV